MKKLFPVLSLLLLVVVSSCEKEVIDQTEINPNTEALTLKTTALEKSMSDNELLENRMEWLAFLSAKVLDNDASKITQINNLMSAANTIKLKDLFGSQNPGFETAFRELLWREIYVVHPDPDHDRDKPIPPIGGSGGNGFIENVVLDPANLAKADETLGGDGLNTNDEQVEAFMDYLQNQHCLELYFPNGQIFYNAFGLVANNPNNYITTTAHPLNSDSFNAGIKRKHKNMPYTSDGYTASVTVNPAYVSAETNIIVARPFYFGSNCSYSDLGGLDFTLFLD
ncbi:hypothetical protein [Gilvibacter sediminis]|uniref:hypothetical protein n=1 Tax=Gilvibacter sediminis TaxID=379071 RepID=UPI00234FBF1B|nr:hypothetical protein [Gilvibacter sediminis]MDC7997406.1 hypothetical protein [Gilvibacter sediminis]